MNSAMPEIKTAGNELYASLPPEVCLVLEKHERHITVPRGQRLMEYGVLPKQLFILNSGKVEISVPGPEAEVSLGTAGPGKVFGMRALVSGETPEIDVTPLEDCEVTVIPGPEFLAALQTTPQIYFAVAKVLSADLKIADQLIRNCARKSFSARKV
jgi:CRP-like cAMP-binding protein